jgi:predicted phosphodiesterase
LKGALAGMTLRIAVVSDLHVFEGSSDKEKPPSYIGTADPNDSPTKYPFSGLEKLIKDEGLSVDLLICPGDITNQAGTSALQHAWQKLHNLKDWLGATHLLATNGNHDIDSRYGDNDFDPKGAIQSLSPMFPGATEEQCDRYWSRNFVVLEHHGARLVLLNSAAFHGYGTDQEKEYEQGRISQRTLLSLQSELAPKDAKINILICHHHPFRFNEITEADYSEMQGGSALLQMLANLSGEWLIIHGHKHFPKLAYSPGDATSPVIFSAGSFSVVLHPTAAQKARNQFYIIDLPVDELDGLGLDLAGKIRAWDWISLKGWQPAGSESGLPRSSGFGWRESPSSIAKSIVALLPSTGSIITWAEIVSKMPKVEYLLPSDKRMLVQKLREKHNVKIVPHIDTGEIDELGVSL